MRQPRMWFRMETRADAPDVADIYIFDLIGDWIDDYWELGGVTTAKTFLAELQKLPESVRTLRVHVNSPGGDVFSALTIANMLRAQSTEKQRTVEISIEGLAASAATIITSAGDVVRIADNALMMIHNPWSWVIGSAAEMRQAADELDKVRGSIIATYRWVSSLGEDEIAALMDGTTWLNADEALAAGFATEKVEGLKAVATFDPKALAKLPPPPERYRDRIASFVTAPPTPPAAGEPKAIIAACREAGFPEFAEDLLGQPMAAVTARLESAKQTKTAADARVAEIRALCDLAKAPQLVESLTRSQMSIADVKTHLATVKAIADKAEIDSGLKPDAEASTDAATSREGWGQAFAQAQRRWGKRA